MSILTRRPALRWLVPAGIVVALVGGGAAVQAISAAADPTLPPRTAAQLLVDLQTSKFDGGYGTVTQSADLGLPSLPGVADSGPQGRFLSLASGAHTMRVWYSGPDKMRVAVLDTLGETDVIRSGRDVWTWDSHQNAATHDTLPDDLGASADEAKSRASASLPADLPTSPREAAEYALKAIDPSTIVSTAGSARVAGRSAYELVLTPRDGASLVGQVRFAIDSTEHVPLRVQVYPKGSNSPAFESAFTQISFDRPDDAKFRFNPPPGAKVVDNTGSQARDRAPAEAAKTQHAVIGTGWTSVLAVRVPQQTLAALTTKGDTDAASGARGPRGHARPNGGSDEATESGIAAMLLDKMPTVSGAWGSGKVLSGKLFSVLLTDDGRVLVGAVSPERLTAAAADPAAALKGGE